MADASFKSVNRALLMYMAGRAVARDIDYSQEVRRTIHQRISEMTDEQVEQALVDWPR